MESSIPFLEPTWRWFGPSDPISLSEVRQTGATGIVTALHHIPNGAVWTIDEIQKRKHAIAAITPLRWSVIESIPVHEDIKRRTGDFKKYIEHYKQSLRNAAACGIQTVCYNFMPVLDWTRTDLAYRVADGAEALRFDMAEVAAFDVYILKRKGAAGNYEDSVLQRAASWMSTSGEGDKHLLVRNIIAGLPGSEESYTVDAFRTQIEAYQELSRAGLRANLLEFLKEIAPVAEEVGVNLAIHPDDPPFAIFGLPRVVSIEEDIHSLLASYDSPNNGVCFCTGSFGARADNDLLAMMEAFGHRVNFLHFRSVQLEADGSFYEANHLEGSAGMPEVLKKVVEEQVRRFKTGRTDLAIPFRPDHGHRMLGNLSEDKKSNPGYSLYGRLRGLAELRGLEKGLRMGLTT